MRYCVTLNMTSIYQKTSGVHPFCRTPNLPVQPLIGKLEVSIIAWLFIRLSFVHRHTFDNSDVTLVFEDAQVIPPG